MRPPAVVALKGGQRQRPRRHKRAAEAAPVGRHDSPAPDARISEVHPSAPAPAVLAAHLEDVAVWRAFLHPLVQSPEALALLLADVLVLAVLKPGAAGFQRPHKARRQLALIFNKIFTNRISRRAVASEKQAVRIGDGGHMVKRRPVLSRHGQCPLGHPQGIRRDKVVGLHGPQSVGTNLAR